MDNDTSETPESDASVPPDQVSGESEVITEIDESTSVSTIEGAPAAFQDLNSGQAELQGGGDLGRIVDIPVQLTVELGRTKVPIKDVLQMVQGSVIELDALAGEPMNVLVNGCLIARGEVVVVNERFGVRLTDIVTPAERINGFNKGR